MTASIGTEIDTLVKTASAKINTAASLAEIVRLLNPTEVSAAPPAKVPTPKEITEVERRAIEHLPEVFGRVVPTQVRALTPVEVSTLIEERETLDTIKKMVEARLKDITVTAHNHLDAEYEASTPEDRRTALRDDAGHYILEGRIGSTERNQEFSRETRQGTASLDVSALAALDTGEDDAEISHTEYLSMTRQVRVFDEARAMDVLRKKPTLLRAIALATKPGKSGTSIYLRKKN